ncbi:hypothetical protein Emed_003286 [Eimeria media]
MGANNSTCLPCRVTGAAARRIKAAGDAIDPRDGEHHLRALKKVSTAAEPQGGSRPAAQASTARGSPTNAAAGGSSQPIDGFIEVNQQEGPYSSQEQGSNVFGPTDSKQLQQGPIQHEHDPKLSMEEGDEHAEEKAPASHLDPSRDLAEARVDHSKEGLSGGEHLVSGGGNLQHQQHIHVPSHMLATETEASWQQHHDSQQALLSPHSCSVAHRVAAALRAAAGERAAAAAARAAEAVKAAKSASKGDAIELQKSFECQQQDLPPPSSQGFRGLRSAAGNNKGNSNQQRHHSPQNGCLSQVPCFNASEERGDELTITENTETEQGTGNAPPTDYFVVAAAKRVGDMFSSAAAAAASVASAAARGENCGDSTGDLPAHKNQRRLEGDEGKDGILENNCEFKHSAAVLLGAVDRAMETINSEDFKKQARSFARLGLRV